MMHFLTVYSTQGKNSLQKFLVAAVDKWKCTPCQFATGEDYIAFQTPDGLDSFVQITFQKVRYVYDGINRMKVKEGGQQ